MINRNTISKLLNKPYDRVLFAVDILKPVFQNFQMLAQAVEANIELTQTEQKAISKVFIYGTITLSDDTEITCYEIILQPSVHIEQSKVSIQQYVRKLLISGQAALINFVSPVNKEIWRFTLVAKDSVLTENGVKETATHAKRYTYLVETGANKQNRTLAERLEKLSSEMFQNFDALVNTFSVETLSKAFFDEYKAHYNKFIQYLNTSNFFTSVFKTNDKTVRDFTKKLLGRLVFLYFVQRKGWLGASNNQYKDGKHDFLMYLFLQSGSNDSFYPVWLKTLFFDTLNNSAKNGDFRMPDGTMVKIPFLNGGLFDKDDIDTIDFSIPSELFHNDTQSEIPVKRGFFDFLNAFNFTIYEDSPDDHTVAVDPEMLGHIFENLLEDNKDKGAFYTPKQIVHYMCQESLIEYLNTKLNVFEVPLGYTGTGLKTEKVKTKPGQLMLTETENRNNIQLDELADFVQNKNANPFIFEHAKQIDRLLDEVKICDPAIGSGAFPVGLLHEIFQLKVVLKEFVFEQSASLFSESHYEPVNYYARLKENIIQNSIYGVDIEKGAVDIARLRFWLSLVVDEDVPKPLPNLDYKIVEGNSLISKFEDEVLTIDWSSDTAKVGVFAQEFAVERIRLLGEISKKQKEYFHSERTDKKALALEIRNLKIDLLINQINLMVKSRGDVLKPNEENFRNKRKADLQAAIKLWEDNQKLLIVNVKLSMLKNNPNTKLQFFDWKLDFPEIMNAEINKQVGFDIVIGNPPYFNIQTLGANSTYAQSVQKKYSDIWMDKSDILFYFIRLSADLLSNNSNIFFIISNAFLFSDKAQKLRNFILSHTPIQRIINFEKYLVFESAMITTAIVQFQKTNKLCDTKAFVVKNNTTNDLFTQIKKDSNYFNVSFKPNNVFALVKNNIELLNTKIDNKTNPLGELVLVGKGMETAANDVFSNTEISQNGFPKSILRKRLNGKAINKYEIIEKYTEGILYFEEFNSFDKLPIEIQKYLLRNKDILENRATVKNEGRAWWRYSRPMHKDYYNLDKLWTSYRSSYNCFAFDNTKQYIGLTNTTVIFDTNPKSFSIKFILALLNSRLLNFRYQSIAKQTGGGIFEYFENGLSKIPIRKVSIEAQAPFIKIVDEILTKKKNGENTEALELQIDEMVYKLYELTEEEIGVVEGKK